ncbi:hypothetical protein [Nocardioides jensenii]|uniref:hypothetical protein n=1 Tax=Nocardioides jensenii TaxID=1843 RepID=UPI000AC5A3A5|nr:hypothetical protein [Nocardioides jensenii]
MAPHTFRKTVTTLIDRLVDSDTAACIIGHSSDAITKEFYIENDPNTPEVTHILQSFACKATTPTSNDRRHRTVSSPTRHPLARMSPPNRCQSGSPARRFLVHKAGHKPEWLKISVCP